VCVCVGEVRAPDDPTQPEPDLVLYVAELIWEPIAHLDRGRDDRHRRAGGRHALVPITSRLWPPGLGPGFVPGPGPVPAAHRDLASLAASVCGFARAVFVAAGFDFLVGLGGVRFGVDFAGFRSRRRRCNHLRVAALGVEVE
jgi:hypothetical protein